MSEPKQYNLTDIERYHKGELSAAERHAMEKAALDDPFLADALEGYANSNQPATELLQLQTRLQERLHKDSRQRRGVFLVPWLRVAALAVLIAGGGWLVYQTLSGSTNNVAKTETTKSNTAPATTDSGAVYSDGPQDAETVQTQGGNPDNLSLKEEVLVRKTPQPGYNRERTADPSADQSVNAAAPTLLAPQADSQDLARIQTPPPVAEGKSVSRRKSDTSEHLEIVLQPSNEKLQEVVVTSTQNASDAKRRMETRSRGYTIDTLEPVSGWRGFNDYVASNLKEPAETKTKPSFRGEVELSFEIGPDGEPVNITITKSLCQACDAEAIRLLKEGPRWKGRGRKGKVKIPFPPRP